MADLFSCWEQGLPQMHELVPLSQALLPFDLATAFDLHAVCDVDVAANRREGDHARTMGRVGIPSTSQRVQQATNILQPSDRLGKRPVSLGQDDNREGSGEDMIVRAMKRPRLVWTPKLHKRFVEAVETMGVDKAVPKTVMQMMGVSGLTRENVASHLQKYRLLLKKQDQERQTDKHSGIPETYSPGGEDVGQQVSNSKQLEGNNQSTPEAG